MNAKLTNVEITKILYFYMLYETHNILTTIFNLKNHINTIFYSKNQQMNYIVNIHRKIV